MKKSAILWYITIFLASSVIGLRSSAQNNCLPSRLQVNQEARTVLGDMFLLRTHPRFDAEYTGSFSYHTTFDLLEGPNCIDQVNWWFVKQGVISGWAIESYHDEYFTESLTNNNSIPSDDPTGCALLLVSSTEDFLQVGYEKFDFSTNTVITVTEPISSRGGLSPDGGRIIFASRLNTTNDDFYSNLTLYMQNTINGEIVSLLTNVNATEQMSSGYINENAWTIDGQFFGGLVAIDYNQYIYRATRDGDVDIFPVDNLSEHPGSVGWSIDGNVLILFDFYGQPLTAFDFEAGIFVNNIPRSFPERYMQYFASISTGNSVMQPMSYSVSEYTFGIDRATTEPSSNTWAVFLENTVTEERTMSDIHLTSTGSIENPSVNVSFSFGPDGDHIVFASSDVSWLTRVSQFSSSVALPQYSFPSVIWSEDGYTLMGLRREDSNTNTLDVFSIIDQTIVQSITITPPRFYFGAVARPCFWFESHSS
ncbi:MAG: hypothetical protein KME04_19980 [Pleurocapsa minor GSE-CHR-MK-17-07R]|jgi:hypothetical protein|nr:hypothetical protein [Pleurocapsa minor GSE-CHR-MK 17-07R]